MQTMKDMVLLYSKIAFC